MKTSRFTFHAMRFSPILALIGVILIFFQKMAFTNLILARGDTFLYFYPYWQAAADALRDGRIPLWNPGLFMGAPFLANSQVGFFYPLNWPLWWLLPTPYAVSASILLHLGIAGSGAYLAGRRSFGLSRNAAWLAAFLFALGGYVTAQVEHVNQLQGMAWLPWFLVVLGSGKREAGVWRRLAAVGILFALQLLAGHTQTVFITGVGIGLFWILDFGFRIRESQTMAVSRSTLMAFLGGGLLALGLTAVQLLPTLELTQFSSRQGGLSVNEVLSFSLHPLLLGRALLPGIGQSLFSEYVAFLPLTAVLLAFVGAGQWRRNRRVQSLMVLTAVGLLLALGRFNPVYWLLARTPGFDLFRVPARWLVWYALGMALLAGVGFDRVREGKSGGRWLFSGLLFLLAMIVWSVGSVPLARFVPLGPESPAAYPSFMTAVAWIVELVLALVVFRLPLTAPRLTLPILALVSLFLASRPLPYNQLTTPEAYFDVRPSIARLQINENEPPERFLSLSDIFFDPGDQAEIDTIYADFLDKTAQYDYTIAIKQKEIIAPNLSMAFGLASVDGFDGGILPLRDYSRLMSLLLPDGGETTDGRLRENLDAVPEAQWLDLFNARYLITDKVGDVWREGVFFDLQHPAELAEPAVVGSLPGFEATELQVIAPGMPGALAVETAVGQTWTLLPESIGDNIYRYPFPEPAAPKLLSISPPVSRPTSPEVLQGLTLVDGRDQTFQPLVLGQYRLIHSGDVKIYENLDVLPRAFLVADWIWQADSEAVLAAMRQPGFDPRQTAVLLGRGVESSGELVDGTAKIVAYSPEKVVIQAETNGTAVLVLTDAYYSGWQAEIDDIPAPVYQADGLFRAVLIEPGEHEIIFKFDSSSFIYGRAISLITLVFLITIIGWDRAKQILEVK